MTFSEAMGGAISQNQQNTEPAELVVNTETTLCTRYFIAANSPTAESDLQRYVMDNATAILDFVVSKKNKALLQVAIDAGFLNALKKCIEEKKNPIKSDVTLSQFSRVCYDYIRYPDHNLFIQHLMLEIEYLLYPNECAKIGGLNMTQDQIASLVCARYAEADDLRIKYKRLIRMIQAIPSIIMDENTILIIFGKFCKDRVRDLFSACMLDRYTRFDSSDQELVYCTVHLVILGIVESLSMTDIRLVLTGYYSLQKNMDKRPRFMIRSISQGDYPRINQTVDLLEEEGIHIY